MLNSAALDAIDEVLLALYHGLRQAVAKQDRKEAIALAKKGRGEWQSLVCLLREKPLRVTKMERCKRWLAGVVGTVPRTMRAIRKEAYDAGVGWSQATIKRALKEMGATFLRSGKGKRHRTTVYLSPQIGKSLSQVKVLSRVAEKARRRKKLTAPTLHLPGTEDRLKIYEERAAAGLPVQHPADAKLPDKAGFTAELHSNHELKGRKLHEPKRPA